MRGRKVSARQDSRARAYLLTSTHSPPQPAKLLGAAEGMTTSNSNVLGPDALAHEAEHIAIVCYRNCYRTL